MTSPTGGGAPRSDYLSVSASVALDSSGNGTVSLSPSVGQYWTPKMVKVGTVFQSSPVAYCAVYEGAATVRNQTTFIDDTSAGSGDTTSMVAGTVVQFGESITAVWSGGNAGDTALLSVYGVSCNTPPSESDMPTTPGTHFAGKPVTQTSVTLSQQTNVTLASGSGILSTGLLDVRNYQSYTLQLSSTAQSLPINFDEVTVQLFWWRDHNSSSPFVFVDNASIITDWLTAGTFNFSGGSLYMQDNHHGAYMSVLIINKSVNVNQTISYTLNGSSRVLSQPFARQRDSTGYLIGPPIASVSAIGVTTLPMVYNYGRARLHVENNSGGNMNVFVKSVSGASFYALFGLASGSFVDSEMILPKEACITQFSMTAAGPATGTFIKLYDGG